MTRGKWSNEQARTGIQTQAVCFKAKAVPGPSVSPCGHSAEGAARPAHRSLPTLGWAPQAQGRAGGREGLHHLLALL